MYMMLLTIATSVTGVLNTRARVAIAVVPIGLLRVAYVTDDGLSLRALRHVPVLLKCNSWFAIIVLVVEL